MTDDLFILEVEEDPITGDQFLTFSEQIIKVTEWKEGDTIEWIDNDDGSFTLKKVEK